LLPGYDGRRRTFFVYGFEGIHEARWYDRNSNYNNDTVKNVDLSVIKNTSVAGKNLQLRFESLNALNHPLFPGPNTNPTQLGFGTISASTQQNYARRTQVMVKSIF
jgi:hypothetical protein